MNYETLERLAIDKLVPEYAERGYEVSDDVKLPNLPSKFSGYVPDLILAKDDRYLDNNYYRKHR